MIRNTAREIAIHLSYELSFTDKTVEELLDQRLTAETFAGLAGEDPVYREVPSPNHAEYIRRLVRGVSEHGAELDGYISKYAKGWRICPHSFGGLRHYAGSDVRGFVHAGYSQWRRD